MGNLSGREGRRYERKKKKKKEEKRRRGEIKTSLRRGKTRKNPKQLNHTHKTFVHEKEFLIIFLLFTTPQNCFFFFFKF